MFARLRKNAMNPDPSEPEKELLSTRPWVLLGRPTWVLACVLLILLAYSGLLGLEVGLVLMVAALVVLVLIWYEAVSQTLIITSKRTLLRKEQSTRDPKEIAHAKVRYLQVKQNALERMLGVGTIQISSIGSAYIEISFPGIKNPEAARELIESHCNREPS